MVKLSRSENNLSTQQQTNKSCSIDRNQNVCTRLLFIRMRFLHIKVKWDSSWISKYKNHSHPSLGLNKRNNKILRFHETFMLYESNNVHHFNEVVFSVSFCEWTIASHFGIEASISAFRYQSSLRHDFRTNLKTHIIEPTKHNWELRSSDFYSQIACVAAVIRLGRINSWCWGYKTFVDFLLWVPS